MICLYLLIIKNFLKHFSLSITIVFLVINTYTNYYQNESVSMTFLFFPQNQ